MTKEVQLNIVNEDKYCVKCGEVLDIDTWGKSYCKTCRAEYNKTYYTEQVAGKRFVYILLGQDNRCLYVGSTKGKYRAIQHLQGHSQKELSPPDWVQLGLDKLVYADVTDITRDDAERYFLEKMYIQIHEPLLNSDNEPDPNISLERIESFADLIYNNFIEFREVDIKKIILPEGKTIFNYSDLILS